MSEFHLNQQYAYQQPQPNVEWYSAATSAQYAPQSYGGYEAHGSTSAAAAYGSFDDEPPLLEGSFPC